MFSQRRSLLLWKIDMTSLINERNVIVIDYYEKKKKKLLNDVVRSRGQLIFMPRANQIWFISTCIYT